MSRKRIGRKAFDNLRSLSDDRGVIAALAIDQRGSLETAIAAARNGAETTFDDMAAFKRVGVETLTPLTSAVLLDPVYGLGATKRRATGTGLLLAYEVSGYDDMRPGRMSSLLPNWSAERLAAAGANGVKLLLHYDPDATANDEKHAFVERVGAECAGAGLPFFLEPVTYVDGVGGLELARRKPELVRRAMREFSDPRYRVDVLKVEFPFLAAYTEGLGATTDIVYDRAEAKEHALEASNEAKQPFIYLSAGVDMALFLGSLELVGEASVPFSGVLCGRATWKEGIPHFASGGAASLRGWLEDEGIANIAKLNAVLDRYASPLWDRLGGLENLAIVEGP